VFIVSCVLLSVAFAQTVPSSEQTILQECFDKDSIACVQTTVYRRAREFFDQPNIKLFGGISFAQTNERSAKQLEPEVEQATSVQAREIALEDYLLNRMKNFFNERQVTWDVATAGRSISNAIPDEVKESVRELVVEGRTKKKILKKLIPILGLLKLKLVGFAVLAVAAIGLIAKKALITSLIAIAIAGASALSSLVAKLFSLGAGAAAYSKGGKEGLGSLGSGLGSGLGNLLGGGGGGGGNGYNNANVEEIIAYNTGSSGWNSGSGNGWNSYDSYGGHGEHSQPIGQAIAYSGHHKGSRR